MMKPITPSLNWKEKKMKREETAAAQGLRRPAVAHSLQAREVTRSVLDTSQTKVC